MIKFRISLTLALALSALAMTAQKSLPLPVLRLNPDARTAALGGVAQGEGPAAYAYGQPDALLRTTARLQATYNAGMQPDVSHSYHFHLGSVGVRLNPHAALIVGSRILYSPSIALGSPSQTYRPNDWTVDVAYAHAFSPQWSAYVRGGYVQSTVYEVARAATFSAGASYHNGTQFRSLPLTYSLGLSLQDLGTNLSYGNAPTSLSQPSSLRLTMSLRSQLTLHHSLALSGEVRQYLPSAYSTTTGGLGLEYDYAQLFQARAGYQHLPYTDALTFGFGLNLRHARLGIAYSLAQERAFNTLSLTVGFAI